MYKILIRPLAIEDAEISWKWRNDPEVWKFTGNRPDAEITRQIERQWLSNTLTDATKRRFAITADDKYIGNVQLTGITSQDAEFHIFIGEKEFWGKGIATEATYQILHYANEVLKLSRVYLYVKKENSAAVNSYHKNGFEELSKENGQIQMVCKLKDLPPPKVSIFCMVYNHEHYLEKTIEGFLMQKSNFSTVIVIGEDYSKDNSRKIILDYATKYPGKFKLILQEKNVGAVQNQMDVLDACKGPFIAICEGDDYWTDPLKLQKQVDFLESNPEFSIVTGKAKFIEEGVVTSTFGDPQNKSIYTIEDFYTKNNLITCTALFRNLNSNYSLLRDVYFGDWMLYMIIFSTLKNSKAKVLDDIFAHYRIHSGGAMAQLNAHDHAKKHWIQIQLINKNFRPKYNAQDIKAIKRIAVDTMKGHIRNEHYRAAWQLFIEATEVLGKSTPIRTFLGILRYRKHLMDE